MHSDFLQSSFKVCENYSHLHPSCSKCGVCLHKISRVNQINFCQLHVPQTQIRMYVYMYVLICYKILQFLKILHWTLNRGSKSSILVTTNRANTRVVSFQLGNFCSIIFHWEIPLSKTQTSQKRFQKFFIKFSKTSYHSGYVPSSLSA